MRLKLWTVLLLAVLLGANTLPPTAANAPSQQTWPVSTPEAQGMDSTLLAEAVRQFSQQDLYEIHSLHIIRNGTLVTEAYFYPYEAGYTHDLASVTKSVMATLIGAAIQQGYIQDVQQPVLSFFEDRTIAHLDEYKRAMTIENLLTMRSGLDCTNHPAEATLFEMMSTPDWVQFTLDLPMTDAPGSRFVYCSSNVHLLAAILQAATGQPLLDFARTALFEPLGIAEIIWPTDPQGLPHGWGDLHLRPEDMAKLGQLYLEGGIWNGQQLLPPDWVQAATQIPADFESNEWAEGEGYGYLWWLRSGAYFAQGRGGQMVAVLPEFDLVVALTGGGGPAQLEVAYQILIDYIVPSIQSNEALAPNPDGTAALQAAIADAAVAAESETPQPVPDLPTLAAEISGQTYLLEPNLLGVMSFSLTFADEAVATLTLVTTEGTRKYMVGLDGVYRWSPGNYALPAGAVGRWTADDTFVVDLDELGNINRWHIVNRFDGDAVTLELDEFGTGLASDTLQGTRQP